MRVGVDVPLLPAPTVQLIESGNLFARSAGPVVLTDKKNILGGTTSENITAGYATFNAVTVSRAETGDILIATLKLGNAAAKAKPAARTKLVAPTQKPGQGAPTPITLTANSNEFSAAITAQTISFSAISLPVYVQSSVSLPATATSGLAVSFTSTTPTICTVSETGSTWSAHLLIGGHCTVTAMQAGGAVGGTDYAPAHDVSQSFDVTPLAQNVTFSVITEPVFVGGTVTLNATASSGLAVSYVALHPAICSVTTAGGVSTANLLALGDCSIKATQGGNAIYSSAPQVLQDFNVQSHAQTITFLAISVPVYPTSSVALSATTTSGLAVSFVSITPTICTVGQAGEQTWLSARMVLAT